MSLDIDIDIDKVRMYPKETARSPRGSGEVGPADLWLPPTQPIDITSLVSQQFGSVLVSERAQP